ncbi:hypothetical protein I6G79_30170 [Burkholderia plantarii]|nr:hypothetical protein [Burkholderia plantarii]
MKKLLDEATAARHLVSARQSTAGSRASGRNHDSRWRIATAHTTADAATSATANPSPDPA